MNSNGQVFIASDGFAGDMRRPQKAFSRLMNAGMPYGTFYISPMVGFIEFPKWKGIDLDAGYYVHSVSSRSGEPLFCKKEAMPIARSDVRRSLLDECLTRAENRAAVLPEGQVFGAFAMRPAKFAASRPGWEAAVLAGVLCQPKEQTVVDGLMQDALVDTDNGEIVFVSTTDQRHDTQIRVAGRMPSDVLSDLVSSPIWGYGSKPVPLPFS